MFYWSEVRLSFTIKIPGEILDDDVRILRYMRATLNFLEVTVQKQPSECSIRKSALRNFTKFTGKHLCQRLFLNKVAGLVAFPWILRNFYKHFFYGAPPVVAANIFPRAIYYALLWPIFDITWKIDVIWEQNIRN